MSFHLIIMYTYTMPYHSYIHNPCQKSVGGCAAASVGHTHATLSNKTSLIAAKYIMHIHFMIHTYTLF